jgi:hypothetical protein
VELNGDIRPKLAKMIACQKIRITRNGRGKERPDCSNSRKRVWAMSAVTWIARFL